MKWSYAEGLADFDRPCKRRYYEWRKGMNIYDILVDIGQEVKRAKQTWGEDFDRRNTLNDWVVYAMSFATDATRMGTTIEQQETYLRKAAGLLVSAMDILKREGFAPRHYEGQTAPKSLPEIK
jgi:hypothetical protein